LARNLHLLRNDEKYQLSIISKEENGTLSIDVTPDLKTLKDSIANIVREAFSLVALIQPHINLIS
jgi:hypothetical protein